jgi:hypothetical protein
MYLLINEQDQMIVEQETRIKATLDKSTETAGLLKSQDTLIETLRKQGEQAAVKIAAMKKEVSGKEDLIIDYQDLQDRYEELETK